MSERIFKESLIEDFGRLGIQRGDVVLIRAALGSIGKISGGAGAFIDALLETVGAEGTIVSLAFTEATFLRKPKIEDAFNIKKKSYAGALPNAMLARNDAFRSRHPMCSYVAIGRYAEQITSDHNENSPAYEPIRKILELNGKNVLIGCVSSSPGFTTTHLAEADLGMLKRLPIFSGFSSVFYEKESGGYAIFRRYDSGLCSNSFYKFYALYVKEGILSAGFVGAAYSVLVPARKSYDIEFNKLKEDEKFNICDSKYCFTCNANRWDRINHLPGFFFRLAYKKLMAQRISKK